MAVKTLALFLVTYLLLHPAGDSVFAQQSDPEDWSGIWEAEGTLFRISVSVTDDVLTVGEVESLGFLWSAEPGRIEGDQMTLQVQTQGVTAELLAELTAEGTAVVKALSCVPDYMVACALAKDRQAIFVRIEPEQPDASGL